MHTIQRLICIHCAETRRWLATLVATLALHWLTLKLNKEKEMIRVHNAHSALSLQSTMYTQRPFDSFNLLAKQILINQMI